MGIKNKNFVELSNSLRDNEKITSYSHIGRTLSNQVFSLSQSWNLYFNRSLVKGFKIKRAILMDCPYNCYS